MVWVPKAIARVGFETTERGKQREKEKKKVNNNYQIDVEIKKL